MTAQFVAGHIGISQAAAEKRVDDTIQKVKDRAAKAEAAVRDMADKARTASAYAALWLVVSILVSAFCAKCGALLVVQLSSRSLSARAFNSTGPPGTT